MSNYLKNRSLDLIQTFYDHCTRERGPLKKILETYNRSRLGDFWGRRKNLKGDYLVEGHSYRSDTSPVTSHKSSTPPVFFSNFYFSLLHGAMTGSILGKTRYGVISKTVPGPPSYYFLLSTMKYVWNRSGIVSFSVLKSSILEKKGWGK